MIKFFKWLFELPDYPAPVSVAKITVQPPVINPTTTEQVAFAEWRAAHIQRFLDDPLHADAPHRAHLEAERDMHLAALRMRTVE